MNSSNVHLVFRSVLTIIFNFCSEDSFDSRDALASVRLAVAGSIIRLGIGVHECLTEFRVDCGVFCGECD